MFNIHNLELNQNQDIKNVKEFTVVEKEKLANSDEWLQKIYTSIGNKFGAINSAIIITVDKTGLSIQHKEQMFNAQDLGLESSILEDVKSKGLFAIRQTMNAKTDKAGKPVVLKYVKTPRKISLPSNTSLLGFIEPASNLYPSPELMLEQIESPGYTSSNIGIFDSISTENLWRNISNNRLQRKLDRALTLRPVLYTRDNPKQECLMLGEILLLTESK
jgi:hypothetical protein